MATFGDRMLSYYGESVAALTRLIHGGYDQDQLRDLLVSLGGRTELFLKSVVFPSLNPKDNFYTFIEKLRAHLPGQVVDDLHALRKQYNDAKHNPAAQISMLAVQEAVAAAHSAIRAISNSALGITTRPCCIVEDRVFWIAGWDHYVGGDTEVHVLLPGVSSHWLGPPTLDIVYVDALQWDRAKSDLRIVGRYREGANAIPAEQIERFRSDSDFAGAFVFEGQYRDLIATLAHYEKRQELIPGLNRHDDAGAMRQAFAMATLDVASVCQDRHALTDEILQQAQTVYGVPPTFPKGPEMAGDMATMLTAVPVSQWPIVRGPTWADPSRYADLKPRALSEHKDMNMLIDQDCIMRIYYDHG